MVNLNNCVDLLVVVCSLDSSLVKNMFDKETSDSFAVAETCQVEWLIHTETINEVCHLMDSWNQPLMGSLKYYPPRTLPE